MRSANKRKRDLIATLEPLEVGGRVLVRNSLIFGAKDISNKKKERRRWTSIYSS